MLRWAMPAAVLVFAMAGSALAGVTVSPAGRGYDIDIDGETSASELLDAIASASGATVKGQPQDATITTNHLRGTTLERAIRQLLPGAAFTIRFGEDERPDAIIFLSPEDGSSTAEGGSDSAAPDMSDPGSTGDDTTEPVDNAGDQAPQ
jgi:hypothetical protein